MSIISNTELNTKRRDRELKQNRVISYMQEKYLELMHTIAIQSANQNKLFDDLPEIMTLKLKCERELGYA